MRTRLQLVFNTNASNIFTMSIPHVTDEVDQEMAVDAMDNIIESNAIDTSTRGDLATKQRAVLIHTTDVVHDFMAA
jgi:hypothetical protein